MEVDRVTEAGRWCRHAVPGALGGACLIYDHRPDTCRTFRCAWLDGALGRAARPDRIKAVLVDETATVGWYYLHVDPDAPGRWGRGRAGRDIARLASKHPVVMRCGDRRQVFASGIVTVRARETYRAAVARARAATMDPPPPAQPSPATPESPREPRASRPPASPMARAWRALRALWRRLFP